MAVLAKPINLASIRLLRGVVDIYKWKGLTVARAWPRAPHQPNSAAQQYHQNLFRQVQHWRRRTSQKQRQDFIAFTQPIGKTWADCCFSANYAAAKRGYLVDWPDTFSYTLLPGPSHPDEPGTLILSWTPKSTTPMIDVVTLDLKTPTQPMPWKTIPHTCKAERPFWEKHAPAVDLFVRESAMEIFPDGHSAMYWIGPARQGAFFFPVPHDDPGEALPQTPVYRLTPRTVSAEAPPA